MKEPKTSNSRMLHFQLYCVCGAVWEGAVPEVVADKVKRTFYQDHRHRGATVRRPRTAGVDVAAAAAVRSGKAR